MFFSASQIIAIGVYGQRRRIETLAELVLTAATSSLPSRLKSPVTNAVEPVVMKELTNGPNVPLPGSWGGPIFRGWPAILEQGRQLMAV